MSQLGQTGSAPVEHKMSALSPNPTEGQPHQAHSDNDIGIPSVLCGPNISMPQIEHRSVSNRVTVIAHLFYR